MMMYYIVAGLLLAVMTIMDDRLELALGVHWATNLFGTVFVNYESSALQTHSLVKTGESNPYLVSMFLSISAIVFLFVCSKKYNWKPFKILAEKYSNESYA
jgi:membrane protease YdiL (CAAX protease family)